MIKTAGIILSSILFLSPSPPPGDGESPSALIEKIWAKWRGVRDYTCVFIKQERVNGKLLPEQTIFMKARKQPFSIYMKWVGEVNRGQEALYVAGKNDGKLKVHPGGILGIFNLNLDPEGGRAMNHNRHPITEAGIGHSLLLIREELALSRKNKEGEITALEKKAGEDSVFRCFRTVLPAEKVKRGLKKASREEYYAAISEVCLDIGSLLPVSIAIYDSKGELLEKYGYREIKCNVGLTDRDFDPDNDEYSF